MTFVHSKAKTENVYVMNNLYLEVFCGCTYRLRLKVKLLI